MMIIMMMVMMNLFFIPHILHGPIVAAVENCNLQ